MKIALLMITAAMGLCLFTSSAAADIKPDFRGGVYLDAESAFLGGGILTGITSNWFLNPNVEFVFIDNADYITFNFDAHYDFPTESPVYFWIGGGLAILYFDPEFSRRDSDTDLGLNFFMGVGFNTDGRIVPYVQPKVILSDNSEVSVAFGIRF